MSSTFDYSYHDPYKVPAGLLTLLAHAFFFTLLYLGLSWQSHAPEGMVVDLWNSLPDVNDAPSMNVAPQQPAPAQKAEPVKPSEPAKPVAMEQPEPKAADIDLGKKHKPGKNEKPVKKKISKAEQQAQADMAAAIKQQEQAEQQAMDARAKQAAALGQMLDAYKAKIIAKIRRNIILPPDVASDAQIKFEITLLPGGDVLDVKLTRKSGNAALDSAVERAIWKASPLPVPADPGLFNSRFRTVDMSYRPEREE